MIVWLDLVRAPDEVWLVLSSHVDQTSSRGPMSALGTVFLRVMLRFLSLSSLHSSEMSADFMEMLIFKST